MDEVLKSIGNYGFPIVVTMYLLFRFETKLEALTKAITEMSLLIAKMKE